MTDGLQFQVGGIYENMKGAYEVISIQKDTMLIRWHDGNEITTSMDLQKRIIERMAWDKEFKGRKDVQKKKSEKSNRKASSPFAGLKEEDFKRAPKNTTWRGRNSVGGAVAKELNSDEMDFGAWAVLMRPEVRWMEKLRHARKTTNQGIGFFARVDERNLYYGVYAQPVGAADDASNGFNAFRNWLTTSENESLLKQIFISNDLSIVDASGKAFVHNIKCLDEGWQFKEGKTSHRIESLSAFFASLSDGHQVDLRVEKKMSKDEALAAGKKIVDTLCSLFQVLMPVYGVASVNE